MRLDRILTKDKGFEPRFDHQFFDDFKLNGSYVSSTNKGDIAVNENNEGFLISYNSDNLTIKVSPNFTTGETNLVSNNTVYNENDPFEIRERIIPNINETFCKLGITIRRNCTIAIYQMSCPYRRLI